jgi:gamma-glutamylcyclotransferase (GGCT)/AIG2-like uncharacterized protein YtfP
VETPNLFVYGTLILDKVVTALIDRVPAHEATTARGWRVAQLPDRVYPGLVPAEHGEAAGRLYLDLTPTEWSTLDAFEDPMYDLVEIELASGGRALTYVWPQDDLRTTWQLDRLIDDELHAYLRRCAAWRRRYEKHDDRR